MLKKIAFNLKRYIYDIKIVSFYKFLNLIFAGLKIRKW
jgi:hypothetical protein